MSRLTIAAIAAVSLGACAAPGAGGPSGGTPASGEPIQIGVIETITGSFAQIGTDNDRGAQMAVDEINKAGGVMGRPLKLVIKDEQLKADVTVQALRELQSAGINITMGYTGSADCLAAVPIAAQNDMLVIGSNCIANPLTSDKFDKHFFRVTTSDAMMNRAAAAFVKDKFPQVTIWDTYAPDTVTGHDDWNLFKQELKKTVPSAQPGKEVFAPQTATDVRDYVSALTSAVPTNSGHGLFLATFGAATAAVVKQGKPAGLFDRFKVTLNLGGSEPTAAQLGADFPDAWFIYDYYFKAYSSDMNTKFVQGYQKLYSADPNSWSYEGYASVYGIRAAIEKAHATDTPKLISAMEGLAFDTPKGHLQWRAKDHELVQPVTVFECKGDASHPKGYQCPNSAAEAADKVSG